MTVTKTNHVERVSVGGDGSFDPKRIIENIGKLTKAAIEESEGPLEALIALRVALSSVEVVVRDRFEDGDGDAVIGASIRIADRIGIHTMDAPDDDNN